VTQGVGPEFKPQYCKKERKGRKEEKRKSARMGEPMCDLVAWWHG
jgi:hypothetical protein